MGDVVGAVTSAARVDAGDAVAIVDGVDIVGMVGGECFGPRARAALERAEVVVGARRHLDAVAATAPEQIELRGPLEEVLDVVADRVGAGRRVCVLASGDPGFFGIARALGLRLGEARVTAHPAPSAVSMAFGRVGLSWDDATVLSAHGRDLDTAVGLALDGRKVAVLTSPENPPQRVGSALIAAGSAARSVIVASRLGEDDEQVVRTDLAGLQAGTFDPLSVVILTPPPARQGPGLSWGLPEAAFAHRDGMITKAEVRAVALGKLALPSAGVLWDVGAGSGSIGIEAARLRPGLRVLAVERAPADAARIRENARAHGVCVDVVEDTAPACLARLPDPDRVFIGGGGLSVLETAMARLRPGGAIVASYALMDRAVEAWRKLGQVVALNLARGVAVGDGVRLSAENPVYVCWGPVT